jgi:hypothetical protein
VDRGERAPRGFFGGALGFFGGALGFVGSGKEVVASDASGDTKSLLHP